MTANRLTIDALVRAFRQIGRILRGNMKPIEGCTPAETIMLYVIRRTTADKPEGIKASDISHFMRVASPTVTQQLNVLEARGLLERMADPKDRRVVLVRLTAEGRRVTGIAEEDLHADMQELIGYLGEARADQLAELLNDVHQYYLDKEGRSDPCGPNEKPNE